jgi:hypothetical protein
MMGGVCDRCVSAVQRSLRGEDPPWTLAIERGNEVVHECPSEAVCLCRCNQLTLPGISAPPPKKPVDGSLF